jgi:hypothetical protein
MSRLIKLHDDRYSWPIHNKSSELVSFLKLKARGDMCDVFFLSLSRSEAVAASRSKTKAFIFHLNSPFSLSLSVPVLLLSPTDRPTNRPTDRRSRT